MKNKKLLQKAGSLILSAALAVSCLSGIPAATATAANVDVSNWQKEIYIDFGTGLNGTGSADSDLDKKFLLNQDCGYTCTGTLIAGYGTWLYDSTDVGTVHGKDATSQKIGFDRALPAGCTNEGGAYFRDWVFSPDGEDYTFSVDLPAGQYRIYVYTGNKTGGYNNTSLVSFSDDGYKAVYDQTSSGGSQYKAPGCVYVVNVDETTAGCGYGTLGVKIFDDTIVTADDGSYDEKYTTSNTVFYGQDTRVSFASNNNPNAVEGKMVTARLNGIEIQPVENAAKAEYVSASDGTDVSIEVGQTKTLAAKASPESATERMEYFSSDEKVVTVDLKTGEITGVAPGKATITATTPSLIEDASKYATYNITVFEQTTLALNPTTLALQIDGAQGTDTGTIKATFDANDLTEAQSALKTAVTSSIATITFGEVTEDTAPADGAKGTYSQDITIKATAKGNETITITRTTGRTVSLRLTVTKPVASIAFYDAEEKETTDKYEMVAGTKLTVKAKVLPEDASNTNVTYSSDDQSIAAITAGGIITAKKSGTVVIKAASRANTDIVAQATLTITPGFEISYRTAGITMNVGDTRTNTLTKIYKDGVDASLLGNQKINYVPDHEDVVKVGEDGAVTALKAGTATITATAEDGGQSVSYNITVIQPATGINIKYKNITLDLSVKSKKTAKINASLLPADSTDSLSYILPKNCKVIKVDNKGQVTALKPGSVTVTVKSTSGKTQPVEVTVKASATKVKVSGKGIKKNKVTLKKGKKLNLTAKVSPSNSTDKVKWSTNKKKIASIKVTKKGVTVTAKKKGNAVITAKAGKKSVKITITVK